MSSVFKIREGQAATALMFFDPSGPVDIQRYETVKYPILAKLLESQIANFWRPTEISLARDAIDFKSFTIAEEHIFTSNLRRQIVLDSVQGRAPSLCFGPVVSDPTVEAFIHTWTFFETVHSASYTHILRNLYADPSKVFDGMKSIREIVECGHDVSKYYDELTECIRKHPWASKKTKRAFYRALVATNALEQIRFHLSFACTFSFANRGKVEGSGRIVTLIRQDEAIHCGFTQNVLRLLLKEDPDFVIIAEEEKQWAEELFYEIYKQEKEWIVYLFSKGPIVGLTEQELNLYLDWLVYKRMVANGIKPNFTCPKKEPLSWMRKFLNEDGSDQPAPQEEEILSYQIGNITMEFDESELTLDF